MAVEQVEPGVPERDDALERWRAGPERRGAADHLVLKLALAGVETNVTVTAEAPLLEVADLSRVAPEETEIISGPTNGLPS